MKFNKLLALPLVLAASTSIANADVGSGTITFNGTVNTGACTIAPASVDKQVPLGSVKVGSLASAGAQGPESNFSLELTDCTLDSGTGSSFSKVNIAFNGSADTTNSTLWKNNGTATNVGVLFQYNGSNIIPGSTIEQSISNGTNTINLSARMQATGAATAGSVTSVAAYTLSYL